MEGKSCRVGNCLPRSLLRQLVFLVCVGLFHGSDYLDLSLNNDTSVTRTAVLEPGGRDTFEIADESFAGCQGPEGPWQDQTLTRYIHVELWNNRAVQQSPASATSKDDVEEHADPMLMVAHSNAAPRAVYEAHRSNWTWTPSSTLVDYEGYRLLRPYSHVVADANQTSDQDFARWHISVWNVEMWMQHTLNYTLRVSCTAEGPCPSLYEGEACSGHGTCGAGRCECELQDGGAWGGVACDMPVGLLQSGEPAAASQAPARWRYFALEVPENTAQLLVELNRTRGDPVLFVKHRDEGFSRGGLPNVQDYDLHADQDSFRSRVNLHYVSVVDPMPGVYYVGVYNNHIYISEQAEYRVVASWGGGLEALCPADCGGDLGRGKCGATVEPPACACSEGWAGRFCEGEVTPISIGSSARKELGPAQWAFYRLELSHRNAGDWADGMIVEISTNGGHLVLIMKRGSYPTMLDNDQIFTSTNTGSAMKQFRIARADLTDGEYIFGIFNMDYYTHEVMPFEFKLRGSGTSTMLPFTPYLSIVLGVTVSLFLCLLMSICKRLAQRHGLFGYRAPGNQAINFLHAGMRQEAPIGVDRHVVESFPSYPYEIPDEERGKEPDDDTERNSSGDPSCAICLCAYEEGETMRRLPCNHEFHMKCIDQWLTQHTTCPMCRVSLVSESAPSNAQPGGQSQARDGDAIASPPGAPDSGSPSFTTAVGSFAGAEAGPSPSRIAAAEQGMQMVALRNVSSEESTGP
uniref:E3 ubiquitin-protein ligase RLIM n=1 Tax=Tetraselmis sp. GSL018 TaxID=582737 RepID=A0A061S256_9CHLO